MKLLPNRPPLSLWVVSSLAVILIVLAALQYRWSGQISQAERDRMQASLQTAVGQFRQEFYRELLRVTSSFRIAPDALVDKNWESYAEHYDDWVQTAPHPNLVSNSYLWEAGSSGLLRWNAAARQFEPVEWPANFTELRRHFEKEPTDAVMPPADFRVFAWTMQARIPGLVRALFEFSPRPDRAGSASRHLVGFSFVELNADFLEKNFLPELAQRYFGGPGGLVYQVAVISGGDPAKAIYRSGPNISFSKDAIRSADARVDLLSARPDGAMLFPPDRLSELRRGSGTRTRSGFGRFGFLGAGPMGLRGSALLLAGEDKSQWQLVVKHRSGSLEAAVAGLRRRNLALGFGVLLLLVLSIAIIVISTQQAQNLAKLQMEFVAGVSHELRTPLAVISSAADNLAEGVVDARQQVKQYGSLIRNESRRLSGMVEQILLFAANQAGRSHYDLRPVSIAETIDAAVSDSESTLKAAGCAIEKHIDPGLPPVMADSAALNRCLQNLIGNAVKYGGEAGWIGLRATSQGPEIQITIEDRGLGIDPQDLPHIFEPFYRGSAVRAAQIHGAGLGLNLAKRIAEALGGKLSVQSEQGKGSAFTLHLPALLETEETHIDATAGVAHQQPSS